MATLRMDRLALLHYTRRKLDYSLQTGFFCGGGLIHEYYVLSGWFFFSYEFSFILTIIWSLIVFYFVAAHCVRSRMVQRGGYVIDSVRLGEYDLRSLADCYEVREMKWKMNSHERFQSIKPLNWISISLLVCIVCVCVLCVSEGRMCWSGVGYSSR